MVYALSNCLDVRSSGSVDQRFGGSGCSAYGLGLRVLD